VLFRSVGDEAGDWIHEHPSVSQGRPGSRAPHVWLERGGTKISTIDLFHGPFVLIAGREGQPWVDAAHATAGKFPGLELDAHRIDGDLRQGDVSFETAYGISASGATLVRPDGFVAWRSAAANPAAAAELTKTLSAILMR